MSTRAWAQKRRTRIYVDSQRFAYVPRKGSWYPGLRLTHNLSQLAKAVNSLARAGMPLCSFRVWSIVPADAA